MEENRRISLSGLFIKMIIVIIFVLFTIWLLSLSNKGLSNSLDVLTNNIFSQNMEKMKEVGKEYFTTERLPKNIGEIEALTLEDMYEKKLILELTDKNGNACSAKNSYVSIEKYEYEYQMKVYLECGEEKDYIIVIMGCYDYCDTDICEKVEDKVTEYEYVKTTGGSWTEYGKWSEWSKLLVTNNDYRQVDTKTETENYSYETTIKEPVYTSFEATCEEGYVKTADGTKCYKEIANKETSDPVCPTLPDYKLTGRDGFTCNYSKIDTKTETATCPTGYKKSGNTCVAITVDTKEPQCQQVKGYTYVSRDGFTCKYSKVTNEDVKTPECPKLDGYVMTERNGFTCNYTKTVKGSYVKTETGEVVPGNTSKYFYEEVGNAEYVYSCDNNCAFRWIHTWKVYKAKVKTTTDKAKCPTDYKELDGTCAKEKVEFTTKTAYCPTGYKQSGDTCVDKTPSTKSPVCSSKNGYILTGRDGFTCNYSKTVTKTETATCPTGYKKSGDTCTKSGIDYKELVKTCPAGYKETGDSNECYKEKDVIVPVSGKRDVTYYRYRVRKYVGGTSDYKWSTSKEDKKLLNAGYKLTGKTR